MASDAISFTAEDAVAGLIGEMSAEDAEQFKDLPPVDAANFEDEVVSNDYHPDVWAWGQGKWNAMSDDEQSTYVDQKNKEVQELINRLKGEVEAQGFWESWGPMDLVFVGLAVFTAFQIGMNDPLGDD